MKGKRILAILCAASLCCMSLNCVTPALAASSKTETTQKAEAAAKKKAEAEAKKKAEKEAKKKAEKEAKKKAEKEAKKKAEAEAKKKAEAEAKKKAEKEAKKKAEKEAKKKAEAEAKKKAEAEAKKKAEKEAKKKAEAEAKKKAEAEAKKKATAEPKVKATKKPAAKETEKPTEPPAEIVTAPADTATAAPKEQKAGEAKTEESAEKPAEAATEKPAEAATEKPAEAATEKPAEAATEKPAEAPETVTGAPTETPTGAPTEVPAGQPTGTPTEAPTEVPTEQPTEAPTEQPTEAPTEQPTEAPTEAPTEQPVDLPTQAPGDEGDDLPTNIKGEVRLTKLKASAKEVKPGKKVEFTYKVKNAEKITWEAIRSDGLQGGSGETTKDSFTWRPAKSGVYTVTVKATAGEITKTKKCNVIVRSGKLSAKAKDPTGYAVVGKSKMCFDISVSGGCEPYTVNITIEHNGDIIYMSSELTDRVVCEPAGYGKHNLVLEVIDATGVTAKAKALVRASTTKTNDPPSLPRLNAKMTYAERLVAVAASQVGYREVDENFILDSDNKPQGWSYYGAWYGMPYEEWCVMFVMYCLNKAGMGGLLGVYANNYRWRVALGSSYDDNEDEFIPEPGDIIFFHHDRVSKDPNFPNHVGIVTDYDAEKDIVYTVEGNSGKMVRAKQYMREDSTIVGYVSLRKYMRRWDKAYRLRVDTARAEDRNRLMNRGKDVAIEME